MKFHLFYANALFGFALCILFLQLHAI
jgi:hypothetical protein